MRIVVNDIAASEGGAMSVLKDLYDDVVSNHDNIEWVFLLGNNYLKETENIKICTYPEIKKNWYRRIWFELFAGAKVINNMNPDIYISLQNTATIGVKSAQYVYFHQVIPYQQTVNFHLLRKNESLLWIYQHIGKRVYNFLFKHTHSTIIVQSTWLARKMKTILKNNVIVSRPNFVINMGEVQDGDVSNEGLVVFFYPTSDQRYKNLDVVFSAISYLQMKGITDFKVVLTVEQGKNKKNRNIDFVGKISRDEVYSQMNRSVLIFPSLIESFGLPLLEASAIGTYIVAADLEYAHETLGSYNNVTYFSSSDAKRLSEIMEDIIAGNIKYTQESMRRKKYKGVATLILEDRNG